MDEYIIKARFEDAVNTAYYQDKFLGFLDPAEANYLHNISKYQKDAMCAFWGGFEDAERVFLGVGSDVIEPEEFPITAITLTFRPADKLTHRDFLGSLMSQGVTRASVGDILVEEGRAVIFVKNELLNYFVSGITKIGKVGVKCSVGVSLPLPVAHTFMELKNVVASERADCIIAFLMKSSREKAVQAIRAGIVTVNYEELKSVSQKLKEKDKVSIKGHGKFLIDTLGPYTKKERLIIKCQKFI